MDDETLAELLMQLPELKQNPRISDAQRAFLSKLERMRDEAERKELKKMQEAPSKEPQSNSIEANLQGAAQYG